MNKDGTQRLLDVLYDCPPTGSLVSKYIGGSNAQMLHDAAERITEMERDCDYLLEIGGRAHIRAERAEDRAEKLERERDEITAIRDRYKSRCYAAEMEHGNTRQALYETRDKLAAALEAMECAALTAEQWMRLDGWEEPMADIRNGLRAAALADDGKEGS